MNQSKNKNMEEKKKCERNTFGQNKGRDLIFVLLLHFFCFPSWLLKCCNLQNREKYVFCASPSTSAASFSTSPACPANIPSITSKSRALASCTFSIISSCAARPYGKSEDSNAGKLIPVKGSPPHDDWKKCSGASKSLPNIQKVAAGGGWGGGGAAAQVMIQLGAKQSKKQQGGWGGGAAPPMMIEKVMIQLGVDFIRKGVAGGTTEELAMLRMQEAKAKNPTGKAEDAKSQSQKAAKSHKAKKPPAAAELAMQRMRNESHKSHKNPRKSHRSQKAEKLYPEKQTKSFKKKTTKS